MAENHKAGTGWLSISDAAAQLGMERSALSHYIRKYGLKTQRRGRFSLVHLPSLVRHRQENVRVDQEGGDNPPARRQAGPASRPVMPDGDASGNMTALTSAERRARALATLAEIDAARAQGQLVDARVVDRMARDALASMISALEGAIGEKAAEGALKHGWHERTLRLFLKEAVAHGVAELHTKILEACEGLERDMTAGDREYLKPRNEQVLQ